MRPEADEVADLLLDRPPRLGGNRLVCIDGPAGSGKTTLAASLARALEQRGLGVSVVHLDDLYDGWGGLPRVGSDVARWIVGPLHDGRPGEHPVHDWHLGRYSTRQTVPVADVVILEGVGSGHPGYADRVSLLVWVEAPDELRLARGLDRDGLALEPQWRRWMTDERRLHTRERTRRRADVVVDGSC